MRKGTSKNINIDVKAGSEICSVVHLQVSMTLTELNRKPIIKYKYFKNSATN